MPDSWLGSGGAGSPGTSYSCSPETCRTARLVTTALISGAARSRSATIDAAATTCSKLSRTSRRRLSRSQSPSNSWIGRPVLSATPSALAIRGATSIGSRIGSSGTKKTPSGKSSDDRAASWSDSRVLPVPPGPVSVSSRVPASSRAAVSSSASRPTKVVSWVGRLFGPGVQRAQRREVGGQAVGDRPGRCRTGALRSLSRCSPRSRSVTPSTGWSSSWSRVRLGREDLPAVGERRDPRRPVDAETDEALPGLLGARRYGGPSGP